MPSQLNWKKVPCCCCESVSWEAPSQAVQAADGHELFWRITLRDDGRFTLSESDQELKKVTWGMSEPPAGGDREPGRDSVCCVVLRSKLAFKYAQEDAEIAERHLVEVMNRQRQITAENAQEEVTL